MRYVLALFSLLLIFNPFTAKSSHALGGSIEYVSISATEYFITVRFYRECGGGAIAAPPSVPLDIICSGQRLGTTQVTQRSSQDITPVCNSNTISLCNGGSTPGFEEYIYFDTVTVAANCPDLNFSFNECCRNSAITNLQNASSYSMYLYANTDASQLPLNNSPKFAGPPVFLVPVNSPAVLDFGAIDIDGDSLSYHLVLPQDVAGQPIPYASGYSFAQPIKSSTPVVLDPYTGLLSFTPYVTQYCVLTVEVTDHRRSNGQVLSKTIRDIQLKIIPNLLPNSQPNLSGFDSTNLRRIFVCIGDTLNTNIYSVDSDSSQLVSITGLTNVAGGPTATLTGTNRPIVNIQWLPGQQHVSATPAYTYNLKVMDDACPLNGISYYNYEIFVTNCTGEVWPGDANADYVANHYDILNIGRAFNYTGPIRAAASPSWSAQSAANWSGSFYTGLNYKNADCNGDGTVDSFDLDVITLNFGQTHLKDNMRSSAGIPITIESTNDTFSAGATINLPISLGTIAEPASNVYGLAFTIDYDENIFDASTFAINFDNNWLGNNGNEAITYFNHNELNGSVDIAISRNNQTDLSGIGELCNIKLTLKSQLPDSFSVSNITVRGSQLEDFNENNIAVNEIDASFIVIATHDSLQKISEIGILRSIYPNPANNSISVTSNTTLTNLAIYSINGKLLDSYHAPNIPKLIDISALESGVYLISGQTSDGKRMYARFVKMGAGE